MAATSLALTTLFAAAALPAELQPISLARALAIAQAENPDVVAATHGVTAQRETAAAVRRALWPRLGLTSTASYADTGAQVFGERLNRGDLEPRDFDVARLNDPDPTAHLVTAIELQVPIDLFGSLDRRARIEDARGDGLEAQVSEARLQLAFDVIRAYQQALLADEAVAVTRHALGGARSREDEVTARAEEGALLEADLLRARARRRQREADVASAEGDLAVLLAVFNRALGEGTPRYRPEGGAAISAEHEGEIDAAGWVALALERRPLLRALEAESVAATVGQELARRATWPGLMAFARIEDDRESIGRTSGAGGVGLGWNVFDPAAARRRSAAAAAREAVAAQVAAARDQVELEVRTAVERLRTARARRGAAEGGTAEGREALRVIQERRRSGLATLTDELETESASLSLELAELRATTDVAIALAALERSSGGGLR